MHLRETPSLNSRVSQAFHEKHTFRISPVMCEQRDGQNHFCVEAYCSLQSRLLVIDFDSGFVDFDPPRHLRPHLLSTFK